MSGEVRLDLAQARPQPQVEVKKNGKVFINGTEYKIHNLTIGKKEIIGSTATKALTEHQCLLIKELVKEAFTQVQDSENIQEASNFDQLHIGTTKTGNVSKSYVSVDYKSGDKKEFNLGAEKTDKLFKALHGGRSQTHLSTEDFEVFEKLLDRHGAKLDGKPIEPGEDGLYDLKEVCKHAVFPRWLSNQNEVLAHIQNVRGDWVKNRNIDAQAAETQFWTEFEEIRDIDKPQVQEAGSYKRQLQKDRSENKFDKADIQNLAVKLSSLGATFKKTDLLGQLKTSSTIGMDAVFNAITLPNELQNESDILAKIRLVKEAQGDEAKREFWKEFDKDAIRVNSDVKTFTTENVNRVKDTLAQDLNVTANFEGLTDPCSYSDILNKITIVGETSPIAKYLKSEKEELDATPEYSQSVGDVLEQLEWCTKTKTECESMLVTRTDNDRVLKNEKEKSWKAISKLFKPDAKIEVSNNGNPEAKSVLDPEILQINDYKDQFIAQLKALEGKSDDHESVVAFKSKLKLGSAIQQLIDAAKAYEKIEKSSSAYIAQTGHLREIVEYHS